METILNNSNNDTFWIEDQIYSWVKLFKEREIITLDYEDNNSSKEKPEDIEVSVKSNDNSKDTKACFNTQVVFKPNTTVYHNEQGFVEIKGKVTNDNKIKVKNAENITKTVDQSELSQFIKIKVKAIANNKVFDREIIMNNKDKVSDLRTAIHKNIRDLHY